MDTTVESNHIINAFEKLGGNPQNAIDSSMYFDSTSGWIHFQATQVAATGAGALLVPGAHVAAILADISFLLHKMSYCSWGVGNIMGSPINAKEDFVIILGLWAGAITKEDIPSLIETLGGITALVGFATFFPKTTEKIIAKGFTKGISKGTTKVASKVVTKGTAKGLGKIAGKLLSKFSAKIAAKITAKISVKSVAGFVPFLGPVVGGGINVWFIERIGESAKIYYAEKLRQIKKCM